jgi:cytochrome c oxidase assembly protein subunit 11
MSTTSDKEARKRRTLWVLGGVSLGMFGFGFAMVPLYGILCQVTGIQSLEQRAALSTATQPAASTQPIQDRWVTVKFDGTVHPDLPWGFTIDEHSVRVHPGQTQVIQFTATNRSSSTITGQAIASITPWQATPFFHKLECFCFTQQTLAGGETRDMPLRFVVSPDLPADIRSLTLSYNFMRIADSDRVAQQ